MMVAESLKRYSAPLLVDDNGNVVGTADDPGAEVDRLCREFAATHRCSYQEAFQAVTTDPDNWDVVRAYALS